MSLHTSLPIYKAAYDLLDLVIDLARNMHRDLKVLIGSELRDECTAIAKLISRANRAVDKLAHLDAIIERLETIELLLRLSLNKRLISKGQYATAIELTRSVGRQAGGWRNSALRPIHRG